jgi:nitrogen fixation NifU-like protein
VTFVDGSVTPAELILDHARRRVGAGLPSDARASVRLISPTCGDVVTVALVETDSGVALRWDGRGCEVSQASASMLAELGASAPVEAFLSAMATRGSADGLGDAEALLSLAGNPMRAKCATLAWRAAAEALAQ